MFKIYCYKKDTQKLYLNIFQTDSSNDRHFSLKVGSFSESVHSQLTLSVCNKKLKPVEDPSEWFDGCEDLYIRCHAEPITKAKVPHYIQLVIPRRDGSKPVNPEDILLQCRPQTKDRDLICMLFRLERSTQSTNHDGPAPTPPPRNKGPNPQHTAAANTKTHQVTATTTEVEVHPPQLSSSERVN